MEISLLSLSRIRLFLRAASRSVIADNVRNVIYKLPTRGHPIWQDRVLRSNVSDDRSGLLKVVDISRLADRVIREKVRSVDSRIDGPCQVQFFLGPSDRYRPIIFFLRFAI